MLHRVYFCGVSALLSLYFGIRVVRFGVSRALIFITDVSKEITHLVLKVQEFDNRRDMRKVRVCNF